MPTEIFAMKNKILEQIEKYDSILLFRHVYPDMDALGSQFGFASWLKDKYPSKTICCAGMDSDLQRKMGVSSLPIDDSIVSESLGILLDASTSARVDDQRFKDCAYTIRIDHHVHTETFCDLEWIDDKASATCEMLALWLKDHQMTLPFDCANLLYSGLIADNIRFTTKSVTADTFLAAQYLMQFGVDVISCDQINFSSSWSDYQYETKVRSKAIRKDDFLYAILEQDDYVPLVQTFARAKEKVYALSGIEDITIWALFTRMDDGIHYSASLRSRTIDIRDVAQKYHGGGHACACGIKNLTLEQVEEIVLLLKERSRSLSISVSV